MKTAQTVQQKRVSARFSKYAIRLPDHISCLELAPTRTIAPEKLAVEFREGLLQDVLAGCLPGLPGHCFVSDAPPS